MTVVLFRQMLEHMTKNWKITEKIIGTVLIIWGCFLLILTFWSLKQTFDILFEELEYSGSDLSITKIVKNYHYRIIIPVLTFITGITIILQKRAGWLLGILISAINSTSIILLPWTHENLTFELLIIVGTHSIIFFIFFILLINKQFRNKYNPSKKAYLILSILFILLILDKLFI